MTDDAIFRDVPTDELIRLHNLLSGGYWLRVVRTALNWRTIRERDVIERGVGTFSWDVISGRVKG